MTRKEAVAAALKALADSGLAQSATARIEEVLKDIEAALASRVPRSEVVKTLNEQGIPCTLRSFDSALYRLRKRRSAKATGEGRPDNHPCGSSHGVRPAALPAADVHQNSAAETAGDESIYAPRPTRKFLREQRASRVDNPSTNPLLRILREQNE